MAAFVTWSLDVGSLDTFLASMSDTSTDQTSYGLAAIESVSFSPVKKDRDKRRLSRIGFSSTGSSEEADNSFYTNEYDDDMSQQQENTLTNESFSKDLPYIHQTNKSTSSFNLPKVLDSTLNKFHKSNNSTSNINTTTKIIPNKSRSNSTTSIKSASMSNVSPYSYLKRNSSTHQASPKKPNSRYLATSNDHTLHLMKTPDQSTTSSNSSRNIPVSSLPQFNHVVPQNQTHAPQRLTSPPTLVSSTSSLFDPLKNKVEATVLDVNNSSNADSGSSTNSKRTKKLGRGLLKSVAKNVHGKHQHNTSVSSSIVNDTEEDVPILTEKSTKLQDSTEHNKFNHSLSRISDQDWSIKTNTTDSDDSKRNDHKYHLVSPMIIEEFKILHNTISNGTKKSLELLDRENQKLLESLDNEYANLEEMHKQLIERTKDLDSYIENMSNSKLSEVQTLNPNVMCNNLEDLEVRIDDVKGNMATDKETLKSFASKLTVIQELRTNNKERSKYFATVLVISSAVLLLGISANKIFF